MAFSPLESKNNNFKGFRIWKIDADMRTITAVEELAQLIKKLCIE